MYSACAVQNLRCAPLLHNITSRLHDTSLVDCRLKLESDLEKGYELCTTDTAFPTGHKLPDRDDLLFNGTSFRGKQVFHAVKEAFG